MGTFDAYFTNFNFPLQTDECEAFRLVQEPAGVRRRFLLVEELAERVSDEGGVEVVDVALARPRAHPARTFRLAPSAKMRFDGAAQRAEKFGEGTSRAEIHYFPDGLGEQRQKLKQHAFRTLTVTQDGAAQ